MSKYYFILLLSIWSYCMAAQEVVKPIGCYAGTNGTHPDVLTHPEARGVLVVEKWSNIEITPDEYDFTLLQDRINQVKAAGLHYSLAIAAGAFGSPDWLMDDLDADYHSFQYQNQDWRLPLWWDPISKERFNKLIVAIGNQYALDPLLSHVYISQMTVNGIEGHLNGVDMLAFANDGYSESEWIDAALSTAHEFANAFPDKPLVFEVHEIDRDTIVPAIIINELSNDPSLCDRIGLGMWWISGKTSYQSDLIDFIYYYKGDKYAQIIGRSDQPERFQDSLYNSVFAQAKYLNIRYIEPWPYEFQHQTHDALIKDFNMWADTHFSPKDTCSFINATEIIDQLIEPVLYPNPTGRLLKLQIDYPYQSLSIAVYDTKGQRVISLTNKTEIDIRHLPIGVYIVDLRMDDNRIIKKFIKE